MPNFVPVEEAAKQSKYSAGHIRHLIRHKLVEGEKVSVIWFVDVNSLRAYEQQMEEAGTAKFRPKSLGKRDKT
jgi:hypothetical protein